MRHCSRPHALLEIHDHTGCGQEHNFFLNPMFHFCCILALLQHTWLCNPSFKKKIFPFLKIFRNANQDFKNLFLMSDPFIAFLALCLCPLLVSTSLSPSTSQGQRLFHPSIHLSIYLPTFLSYFSVPKVSVMVGTLKNASCLINEWTKSERYKMFHSRKVVKLIKINTSMENHASLYRKITSMKIV